MARLARADSRPQCAAQVAPPLDFSTLSGLTRRASKVAHITMEQGFREAVAIAKTPSVRNTYGNV
jgi:hypothetical protein